MSDADNVAVYCFERGQHSWLEIVSKQQPRLDPPSHRFRFVGTPHGKTAKQPFLGKSFTSSDFLLGYLTHLSTFVTSLTGYPVSEGGEVRD